jgi:3-dehydroquinate synthase
MNNYKKKLTHGEAISIGMSLASNISHKLKLINTKDYKSIIEHLKNVGLPYTDKRIENENLYNVMASDKKNSNNMINLILLNKIGQAKFKIGMGKEEIKKLLN